MMHRKGNGRRPGLIALFCLGVLALLTGPARFAATPAYGATALELRQGERIYREGILPSGEQLRSTLKGEQAAPGLTFSCASCHLRSGLGAFDEGVYTPAISGPKLFRPLLRTYRGVEQSAQASQPPLRPGYTDETLAEALRGGRDPNGRLLSDAMPRYLLDAKDAKLLAAYLRTLSSQFSPGVGDTEIRFATVVSEGVPAARRDAMLSSLTSFFDLKNSQVRSFNNPRSGVRSRMMAENMLGSRELSIKSFSLARWTLKGAPETWRAQLEEYNRKEPVFALVGGMVSGSWQPVHRFCEENQIPCLFPATDLPVISDSDWYTLYQSKGYYQEGDVAARYLSSRDELLQGGPVLQVVRSTPEGEALAAGFRQAWRDLGRKPVLTVALPPGRVLDQGLLEGALAGKRPAVLLVWDDAGCLPGLETLGKRRDRPDTIFLSARYLGERVWTLGEPLRDLALLTYPFVFSSKVTPAGMAKLAIQEDTQKTLKRGGEPVRGELLQITAQTNVLTQLLLNLLMDLRGNYYRDNLLDVAGMMTDQQHPLYGRVSFGTGQRYASRGCFVVQLSHGESPVLVKKSGWIAQ